MLERGEKIQKTQQTARNVKKPLKISNLSLELGN